ncbi:hypothetical protein H6F90_02750 [Trichocoleus sp. FACHB-591]|nr:hypothetical protein [Trichocoleus sp. FACHB-591]
MPEGFPHQIPQPRLRIGDRVSWRPLPSQDFGTVTGLQYAPAEHLKSWAWRYLIWLDPQSPSHAWTCTDTAWEADLELLTTDQRNTTLEVGQE